MRAFSGPVDSCQKYFYGPLKPSKPVHLIKLRQKYLIASSVEAKRGMVHLE